MPPRPKVLTESEVLRLPPMLFGAIRWPKGLGQPVGDPASGFRVLCQEHTASRFRIGPGGIEVIPGTGIWLDPVVVAAFAAPDEGDLHVVRFSVPDVHLNMFPDGEYRVSVELTGNWSETPLDRMLGYRKIDPLAVYVVLDKAHHIAGTNFQVEYEPWRFTGP
jgi:hypothetical protein